jgi:hypothetical protein
MPCTTTPSNGSPVERLRHHLATLGQKIVDQPELHIVLRELGLRARREPELREIITSPEEGWRSPLHVLLGRLRFIIIGGGISGLCLAQGLLTAGIDVALYERDTASDTRMQGYRLNIEPVGSRALHGRLPSGRFW